MRCARSTAGTRRWPHSRATSGGSAVACATPRCSTRRPRRPRRHIRARTRVCRDSRSQQEVIDLYRRVWAEAPLEAWGERAGDRLEQIAAALPAPEAAVVRARTAAELVTRGMIYFDHNRNQESESAFAAALGAPGLNADFECKARFYRAQSVWKARQRPRAAPLFDEADGDLRQGRQPRSARQGALPGGALRTPRPGNRDAAMARYSANRDRARRPQLRRRRADPHGGAGDRRR